MTKKPLVFLIYKNPSHDSHLHFCSTFILFSLPFSQQSHKSQKQPEQEQQSPEQSQKSPEQSEQEQKSPEQSQQIAGVVAAVAGAVAAVAGAVAADRRSCCACFVVGMKVNFVIYH